MSGIVEYRGASGAFCVGQYVRIKKEFRHHYGDEKGATWVIEKILDGKDRFTIASVIRAAADVLEAVAGTNVYRLKNLTTGIWVYAPAPWIEESGGGQGTWIGENVGDSSMTVLVAEQDSKSPATEVLEIATMIRAREQRITKELVSMRDEWERRAIEAEQRAAELLETCQKRNVTIGTLRAELERERDTSFANIRNVHAQGGMVLTPSEVRVITRARPGMKTTTWNQLFDHVSRELEDPDARNALLAKLTLLGFSGT